MYIGDGKSNLTAVIWIPYWIIESMRRAGLKPADIVDYEKIKPVLSTHDMATLIAFQAFRNDLIGLKNDVSRDAISQYDYELGLLWERMTADWPLDTRAFRAGTKIGSEHYRSTSRLASDVSYVQDIKARLYGQDNRLDRYDHAYDLMNDIAPNVVGVVIYPGFFSEVTDKSLQLQLVEGLLKVFYGNAAPLHEVAPTSLFRHHLELLSLVK